MPDLDRPFHSILFERPEDAARAEHSQQPSCFPDLNLDQALDWMTTGRGEYQLKPFFYTQLLDPHAVAYRHEVLRDLENWPTRARVQEFSAQMRRMRQQLVQVSKLHYRYQQERWFVDAVDTYCQAVRALTEGLSRLDLSSPGFQGLIRYLTAYTASDAFTSLVSQTGQLYRDLATVSYSIHIKGNRVRVSKYEDEPDYSAEVEKTFTKFKQGAVQDYLVDFRDWPAMNHVEARVLDLVARLYPDVFAELAPLSADLAQDLELGTLWNAMAAGRPVPVRRVPAGDPQRAHRPGHDRLPAGRAGRLPSQPGGGPGPVRPRGGRGGR